MKKLDREKLLIKLNNNNFEIFSYHHNEKICMLDYGR